MFKQVPTARIEELLENHDVHTTVEILIGERLLQKSDDDDSDDLPVIDLSSKKVNSSIQSNKWPYMYVFYSTAYPMLCIKSWHVAICTLNVPHINIYS